MYRIEIKQTNIENPVPSLTIFVNLGKLFLKLQFLDLEKGNTIVSALWSNK